MKNKNTLYSAELIAKYFIWKSNHEGKAITNKKLQKLIYYAQAWNLAIKDQPLFNEKIEAWIHGPVVPSVYFSYCKYSYNPIKEDIEDNIVKEIADSDDVQLLEEVWKVYGQHDGQYLEALSHSETPWKNARKDVDDTSPSSNEITFDDMKSYYRALLNDSN